MIKTELPKPKSVSFHTKSIYPNSTRFCVACDPVEPINLSSIPDDELIEYSTAKLDDLDNARVILLSTRAQAFKRKKAFDKAINDASKVVAIQPTSVEGYAVMGDIYAAEGRHHLAISMFEDGLRAVFPFDWPVLYEKREASIQALDIKMDFVRVLPPEISVRVFSHLTDKDDNSLVECTLVSKHWRNSVFGYPKLWKIAKFGTFEYSNAALMLQNVSMHIKTLSIYPVPPSVSNIIMTLASKSMLPGVERLAAEPYMFSNLIQLDGIRILGNQLTTLVLFNGYSANSDGGDPAFLDSIFLQCPNLKNLYISLTAGRLKSMSFGPSKLPMPLKLETLSIEFCDTVEEAATLERMIPYCPSLVSLRARSTMPCILSLLHKHCPNLTRLCIWSMLFQPSSANYENEQQTHGLKEIYCEITDARQVEALVPLLVKSKDTLTILRLRLLDGFPIMSGYACLLPDIEYSELKKFECYSQKFDSGITKIIRQCSVVDSICLDIEDAVSDDFFLSFAQLSHFRRLKIQRVRSCTGLSQLFAYYSARGQESILEGIQIQDCEAITDEVLYTLADIMSLHTVVIRGKCPLATPEGILKFVRKLGANANLKYIFIQDLVIPVDSAEDLEEIICLKGTRSKEYNSHHLGAVQDQYFDFY